MSKDTKDGAGVSDAMAPTLDSGARAALDSGADTELASGGEPSASSGPKTSPDELIGITLSDRYEITAKIGQGGMGAVYEAKHTLIGKRVAVKVLLDKHAEKDQIVARLKQEARLASSIGHDNIVDITDFGTTVAGRTFVVMEFLEGESLGNYIAREGQIEETRAIHICAQIASALAAAHKKGIVHRDIKPENIFITQRNGEDFVKVVDFGISKSMTPQDEDVRLTQTGMVLGTPLYMSPEQARGDDDLDHRIDIYALGVILYEAVTGEVPFRGKNYLNILTQVISDDPKAPSEIMPSIDRDLESVILKAMAKEREQRYVDMDDLTADLQALSDPNAKSTGARITAARWRKRRERRSKRRYVGWLLAVTGVAGISVVAVTMLMGSGSSESKAKPAPLVVVPADATPVVAPPPADARAAFQTATIHLLSKPSGAVVFQGAREVCAATPCDFEPPKTGEQIELRAELEGYQDGILTIAPELDDGKVLPIRLKRLSKKRSKQRKRRHRRDRANDEPVPPDPRNTDSTGDVMGNPHRKSE